MNVNGRDVPYIVLSTLTAGIIEKLLDRS